jgi:hypothetical protein
LNDVRGRKGAHDARSDPTASCPPSPHLGESGTCQAGAQGTLRPASLGLARCADRPETTTAATASTAARFFTRMRSSMTTLRSGQLGFRRGWLRMTTRASAATACWAAIRVVASYP